MTTFPRCRPVAAAILAAERLLVLSGAGLSVPSGIPDFRSAGGLWTRFPPEDYATIQAFEDDPARVWEMNFALFEQLQAAEPNAGHWAIAELQGIVEVTVATQNIDGLHAAACSQTVLELHGGKDRLVCLGCDHVSSSAPLIESLASTPPGDRRPPRCPSCERVLKPDVVYFGEELPLETYAAAERAARDCDVCLVVGTSASVHPAAGLPPLAHQHGARIAEFNLEATDLTRSGIVSDFIAGSADRTLPALIMHIRDLRMLGPTK